MKAYSCPSCGAELICDASTAATSCPYCGNPTVVPGQFSGTLKPDFIIPFKLSKEDAVAALKNHYKGKPFLPKAFTNGNHIQEIQGVYVPFWMFDGRAEGTADYEGLVTRIYDSGDEEVTESQHYEVRRGGSIAFEKVSVDASSKMPDDHMDSIEPYDYADLKPFSTAYLPGFLADKYDVSVADSRDRADSRCAASLEMALRRTADQYDTCIPLNQDIRLKRGKVHYALLPVWMLHTKWNGKDFLFAMNGQTGKLVGDLPTDMGRFWTTFAAIAAPVTALAALLMWLAQEGGTNDEQMVCDPSSGAAGGADADRARMGGAAAGRPLHLRHGRAAVRRGPRLSGADGGRYLVAVPVRRVYRHGGRL